MKRIKKIFSTIGLFSLGLSPFLGNFIVLKDKIKLQTKPKNTNTTKASVTYTLYTLSSWKIENNKMLPSDGQLQGSDVFSFNIEKDDGLKTIKIKEVDQTSSVDINSNRYDIKFDTIEGQYSDYNIVYVGFNNGQAVNTWTFDYSKKPICKAISSFYLPDTVTEIAPYAFFGYALYDIVINETSQLTTIGTDGLYTTLMPSVIDADGETQIQPIDKELIVPNKNNEGYFLHNLYIPSGVATNDNGLKVFKYDGTNGINQKFHNVTFADDIEGVLGIFRDPNNYICQINGEYVNEGYEVMDWEMKINYPSSLKFTDIIPVLSDHVIIPRNIEGFFYDTNEYLDFKENIAYYTENGYDVDKFSGTGIKASLYPYGRVGGALFGDEINLDFSQCKNLLIYPRIYTPEYVVNIDMPDTVVCIGLSSSTSSNPISNVIKGVSRIKFSNNLQVIPRCFFNQNRQWDMPPIENVTIPQNIKKIKEECLNSYGINNLILEAESPDHFTEVGNNFINNISSNENLKLKKIIVPSQQALTAFQDEANDSSSPWYPYKDLFVYEEVAPQPTEVIIKHNGSVVNETIDLKGHENLSGSAQFTGSVEPSDAIQDIDWELRDNHPNITISQKGLLSWHGLSNMVYDFEIVATAAGSNVQKIIYVSLSIEAKPVTPTGNDNTAMYVGIGVGVAILVLAIIITSIVISKKRKKLKSKKLQNY